MTRSFVKKLGVSLDTLGKISELRHGRKICGDPETGQRQINKSARLKKS
jgi:hypothetical protein